MAYETIGEECEHGIIFMTLHHTHSRYFTWDECVVCENINIASVFRDLIGWQFRTKPLNDISMIGTLYINSINIILEEVTMF